MAFLLAICLAWSAPLFAHGLPRAPDGLNRDTTRQVSPADVAFMRSMIGHHAQAVDMAGLVSTRTRRKDITLLAEKLAVSQRDEIASMRRWLSDHHEAVPAESTPYIPHETIPVGAGMSMDGHAMMPGMLSASQMTRLAASTGTAFDTLFLTSMIRHHEGAVVMVAKLLGTSGAAQDSQVFAFASDVDADQRVEIRRMRAMLAVVRK